MTNCLLPCGLCYSDKTGSGIHWTKWSNVQACFSLSQQTEDASYPVPWSRRHCTFISILEKQHLITFLFRGKIQLHAPPHEYNSQAKLEQPSKLLTPDFNLDSPFMLWEMALFFSTAIRLACHLIVIARLKARTLMRPFFSPHFYSAHCPRTGWRQ